MASTSLTLPNAAAVNKTFVLASQSEDSISYLESTSSLAKPLTLGVSFDLKATGVVRGSDRIKVAVRTTGINATTLEPATGGVSVDITVPRDETGFATSGESMDDLRAFLVAYLTSANFVSLCRGIAP